MAPARLADEDSFHYLTELLHHPRELAAAPEDWLPWTYRATLARAPTATSGP